MNGDLPRQHYETGGGIVMNDQAQVLLLERYVPREEGMRHEVRLPKGRIEEGESPMEAAVREVGEESGYQHLEILTSLGRNQVSYEYQGIRFTRKEFYFLMRLTQDINSGASFDDPNSEEALFEVRWADNLDEAAQLLTYDSEKLFARLAKRAWQRLQSETTIRES